MGIHELDMITPERGKFARAILELPADDKAALRRALIDRERVSGPALRGWLARQGIKVSESQLRRFRANSEAMEDLLAGS